MTETFKLYSVPGWRYTDAIEKESLDIEIPLQKPDSIVNIEHNRIFAFLFFFFRLKIVKQIRIEYFMRYICANKWSFRFPFFNLVFVVELYL